MKPIIANVQGPTRKYLRGFNYHNTRIITGVVVYKCSTFWLIEEPGGDLYWGDGILSDIIRKKPQSLLNIKRYTIIQPNKVNVIGYVVT